MERKGWPWLGPVLCQAPPSQIQRNTDLGRLIIRSRPVRAVMWWVPWRASQVLSLPSKNIPGETQWELQRPRLGVWVVLELHPCVPCPQAPGLVTTPTARALNTSAKGTSFSADFGARRTRSGSASGPGPPKPVLWAPTTCAKVSGP